MRRGFSIQPWIPASPSLPLSALNRHGSTAVTRRGTDVTLIARRTSLSFGSLDLKAWASPLRCDRLSFSAQKPYYQGSRPTRGSDLSTQSGRDLGTLPSEPRGLGGPPSSELQSALHSVSDLPPTPTPNTSRDPSPTSLPAREGREQDPGPCSPLPGTTALTLQSVPSLAPFNAPPTPCSSVMLQESSFSLLLALCLSAPNFPRTL